MSMRIWLKPTILPVLIKKVDQKTGGDIYYLEGTMVYTDEVSGERYIHVYADPILPGDSLPRIPRKYVNRITYWGEYCEGLRPDGIYHHKGATAHIDTMRGPGTLNKEGPTIINPKQRITISAGSFKTIREIYALIRTAKLKPTQDWSADAV